MPTATKEPMAASSPPAVENQTGPVNIEVTVRPIEPKGKLIGFATVTIGGVVTIPDFRVFNGEKGLFVGNPSIKDAASRTGYRDTARLVGDDIKNQVNVLARNAYIAEVQKLQSRAAAVITPEKPRIRDQLDNAGREAAKAEAARPEPQRAKETAAHDDR